MVSASVSALRFRSADRGRQTVAGGEAIHRRYADDLLLGIENPNGS
jgi:hypothetical protein